MDIQLLSRLKYKLIARAQVLLVAIIYLHCSGPISFAHQIQVQSQTVLSNQKSFSFILNNNLLTLNATDADLRVVLQAIAQEINVPIKIGTDVKGTVSTKFHSLSIDKALERIAGSYSIVFSGKNTEAGTILEIVVLSSGNVDSSTRENNNSYPNFPNALPNGQLVKKAKTFHVSNSLNHPKSSFQSKYVSSEINIRFKENFSEEKINALNGQIGATVKTFIKAINYYVLSLPPDISVNEALRWYQNQGVVDKAEPNYLIEINAIPEDPDFSRQWGLHNTSQDGGTNDADIDAPEAWDIERGRADVVIAIIDTGVDYGHVDLSPNIWHNRNEIPDNQLDDDGNGYIDDIIGWDFVDVSTGHLEEDFQTPDNDPIDIHGHGTHVASIAAAVADNGVGIAGVAPYCKIMPLRAGFKTSSGVGQLESAAAAQAIIYATENGAQVINLSWGDNQKSSLIEDSILFAINRGSLICAAAGNENSPIPIFPAGLGNNAVLAVGATDNLDQKSIFSNYGEWVDVSGPGTDTYGAYLNNSYTTMSGTSMATPLVAGQAALLFSFFHGISPIEVKSRIMRSVDVLPALFAKNSTSGRINLYESLNNQDTTPYFFSVIPNISHVHDQVLISGDQFGDEQGNGMVQFFPGIAAEIISWNNNTIICKVPVGAKSGKVAIINSAGNSNEVEFTVLPTYYNETLINNEFTVSGNAQGWQADDRSWFYRLPFSFPFFGKAYDSVYISSNGYLDFTNSSSSHLNSVDALKTRVMIAPLWDDILTNGTVQQLEDIYIHSPVPGILCIRWTGELYATGDPVNVEIELYEDGRIIFHYGTGNINLSPTIGISGGDGNSYHLATHDSESELSKIQSVLFSPIASTFTIPLQFGWNLISLPLTPDNSQVNQVMESVADGIESVWGYQNNQWQVYTPGQLDISNFNVMKVGNGYWVKCEQGDQTIQLHGVLANNDPLLLDSGWNLIGFKAVTNMGVEEAVMEINEHEKVSSIWGFHNGKWQLYDPAHILFSDLEMIEAGRGYWVNVSTQ